MGKLQNKALLFAAVVMLLGACKQRHPHQKSSLAADQSFLRRPGGALVVRLSVDLQTVGDDRERGHELLREFLGLLRTSLVAPGS